MQNNIDTDDDSVQNSNPNSLKTISLEPLHSLPSLEIEFDIETYIDTIFIFIFFLGNKKKECFFKQL